MSPPDDLILSSPFQEAELQRCSIAFGISGTFCFEEELAPDGDEMPKDVSAPCEIV